VKKERLKPHQHYPHFKIKHILEGMQKEHEVITAKSFRIGNYNPFSKLFTSLTDPNELLPTKLTEAEKI
jgi:hypothetical protein